MIKRWLQFLGGLELIALGVAFSIKADLRTSPISSLPAEAFNHKVHKHMDLKERSLGL